MTAHLRLPIIIQSDPTPYSIKVARTYRLRVSEEHAEGINCGITCTELFDTSSQVTLTTRAASGSSFTGWSGAGAQGLETVL